MAPRESRDAFSFRMSKKIVVACVIGGWGATLLISLLWGRDVLRLLGIEEAYSQPGTLTGFLVLVVPLGSPYLLIALVGGAFLLSDVGRDLRTLVRSEVARDVPAGVARLALVVACAVSFLVAAVVAGGITDLAANAGWLQGSLGSLQRPDAGVVFENERVRIYSPGRAGFEGAAGFLVAGVLFLIAFVLPVTLVSAGGYLAGKRVFSLIVQPISRKWPAFHVPEVALANSSIGAPIGVFGMFGTIAGLLAKIGFA